MGDAVRPELQKMFWHQLPPKQAISMHLSHGIAEELVMMGDAAGLELETIAGMAYDPLGGVWRMSENTGVNYITYFQKSGLIAAAPAGGAAPDSADYTPPLDPVAAAEAAATAGAAGRPAEVASGEAGSGAAEGMAAGGPRAGRRPVPPVEPLSPPGGP